MRFVWAVVAFFFAALLIGAGIAQRTVFVGPDSEQASIQTSGELPYTLIDGAVLGKLPGPQNLTVRGDDVVFVSYGRTPDMTAWLSDATYDHVTLEDGEITTTEVAATVDRDADAGSRNPSGSDLWLEQFREDGAVAAPLQLPADMSILVASDGEAPAPSDITVSWQIDNSTPWAGPLIVAGGVLFAVGLLLYLLGILHVRKSRGPRRKGLPPLADTQPIELSEAEAAKGVISSSPPTTRRAVSSGRRAFAVVPVVAVSALLFAGCSSDSWPQMGGDTPTPTPSSTVIVPEGQQEPAVTRTQATRIVADIANTVAKADEDRDEKLLATRVTGMVLEERKTNYSLRGSIADHAVPAALPAKPIEILLPQAYDEWPRTVLTVVRDAADSSVPPTMMMLTQMDPWSDYKLAYVASMEAAAELPPLAPDWLGAAAVQPDSKFLVMPPGDVAGAYADVLTNGQDSEFYDMFDIENDQFYAGVVANRKDRVDDFNQTGAETGQLSFETAVGDADPLALATLEIGAIVAVNVNETDVVKPTNEAAVIKLEGNETVKALTGTDQSATGFTTTFSDQLFFYVPGQGSDEKIRLLGYGSNILSAKVIE